MATAVLELKADASQLKREAKDAEKSIKSLAESASGKGAFSQLNIGAKDLTQSLRSIKDQFASGDIFGGLASSAKIGGNLVKNLALSPILGPTAVAMAAVGGAAAGMFSAINKGAEMNMLAESSAMTTKGMMGLQYALQKVGIDVEEAPGLMSHFANALMDLGDPASKTSLALQKIGLNAKSFQGKTIEQSLGVAKQALDSTTNSTYKLLAADALFSERRGSRMIPALKGLDASREISDKNGVAEVYQKSANTFIEFQAAIQQIKPAFDGFFAGMAEKVIPEILDAAKALEGSGKKLVTAGERFGDLIVNNVKLLNEVLSAAGNLVSTLVPATKVSSGYESSMGSAFMGMGGMGGFNMQAAIVTGQKNQEETPKESSFMRKLFQSQAGEGDPTKAGQGLNILQKPVPFFAPIVDSLTKIGGGGTGVGNNTVDIQREQLSVLRTISDGVKNWAQTFKPDTNSYLPSIYGNSSLSVTA
jgi:hypothetical protein